MGADLQPTVPELHTTPVVKINDEPRNKQNSPEQDMAALKRKLQEGYETKLAEIKREHLAAQEELKGEINELTAQMKASPHDATADQTQLVTLEEAKCTYQQDLDNSKKNKTQLATLDQATRLNQQGLDHPAQPPAEVPKQDNVGITSMARRRTVDGGDDIEALVASRYKHGELQVLARWRGEGPEEDEWFAAADIQQEYPSVCSHHPQLFKSKPRGPLLGHAPPIVIIGRRFIRSREQFRVRWVDQEQERNQRTEWLPAKDIEAEYPQVVAEYWNQHQERHRQTLAYEI